MKKTPSKDVIKYLIELLALNPEMGQVEKFEKQIRADLVLKTS
jgi:hypothetical protein